MGCVCCSLSSFVSIVLDALERVSLCTVCAMLTCCLMLTLITVMVMGIGIGFHYCFVQNSVDAMEKAAAAAGAVRSGNARKSLASGNVMRSVDKAVQRGFAHRLTRREADTPPLSNNDTNSSYALETNFTRTNVTQSIDFTSTNVSLSAL
ncbi:uncharacterized protein LOC110994531 [Pieris rapae]|uniref:uncharacterized protein LOC110994531 n=1 Tax=Pieris rapae TaxID=64459 RepID=UPI001E27D81B|nr:uncharacterized protein LOC110994531 [Pieris rapae]